MKDFLIFTVSILLLAAASKLGDSSFMSFKQPVASAATDMSINSDYHSIVNSRFEATTSSPVVITTERFNEEELQHATYATINDDGEIVISH